MVNYAEERVMRPLHFAIIDEVDSILIDEARTPLIISGEAENLHHYTLKLMYSLRCSKQKMTIIMMKNKSRSSN